MRILLCCVVAFFALAALSCDVVKSAQLEQAVIKALKDDPRTAEYTFEVSLQDAGQVLITGTVFTPAEVDYVTEIAKSVEGVELVLNRVAVEEPGSGLIQDEVVNTPFL
ncbi:BON domain-containing protein [bacterium]|nr:BON domain-containing protein [bacterium]